MIDNKNQNFVSDKKMPNEPVVLAEIEEMEDRIAPGWISNHNETLAAHKLDSSDGSTEIEEVEARVAPGWTANHSETWVADAD
jgi:hypothetical protein